MFIIKPRVIKLGEGRAKLRITLDLGRDQLVAPQTQLRLIVYDFDQYVNDQTRQAEEAADKGEPLDDFEIDLGLFSGREGQPGFPQRRLVLGPAFLSPTPKPGNGILAVADLNLRRTENDEVTLQKKLGAGPWFVNEVVGEMRTLSDSPFSIGVEMFARRDDQSTFGAGTLRHLIIGNIGMAKQDAASLESPRILAFRLISPTAQGPLQSGTIVLSSLNPLDNRVGVARGLRSRGIQLDIKSLQESLKKPGGATPQDPGPGPLASRRATPDLTGRYELEFEGKNIDGKDVDVNAADYIAPASLWLSQAGQALVGWYLPYFEIGFDQVFSRIPNDKLPVQRRVCIMAAASDTFPQKAITFWCLDAGAQRIDPDELITSVAFPDESNDVLVALGDIEVLDSGLVTRVELVFSRKWALSDVPGQGAIGPNENATVAVFRRVLDGSRLPWTCVRQLATVSGITAKDIDAVIRTHIEPPPSGFWVAIGRVLRDRPMAAAIVAFSKTRDSREIVRQQFDTVSRIIEGIVGGFPNAQYRTEALAWVVSYAKQLTFTGFADDEKTLEEWLIDIATTHMELELKEAEKAKGGALTEGERTKVRDGVFTKNGGVLRDIGAFGGGNFEYSFEFKALAASVKVIVGGAIGVFSCTVRKREIKKDGSSNQEYSVVFAGGFLGFGAGFGVSILAGKSTTGGSGSPPSCTIRSFHDIKRDDWGQFPTSGPSFRVAAVATGISAKTAIGDVTSALSASSTLFSVTVPGDVSQVQFELSGIVEKAGQWSFSPPDVTKVMEKIEKGEFLDVKAQIFSISESIGKMIPIQDLKSIDPPKKELPIVPDQDKPVSVTVDAPAISFEKGSSIIQANQLLTFDRRLAVFRRLFELPGWYWSTGFTSPEWNARADEAATKNQQLSQNRALAVDAVIRASLGDPGQGIIEADKQHVPAHGAGRGPSLAPRDDDPPGGGLHDPYAPDTSPEDRQREEQEEYHKWRRVDVVVNATLSARIWGE